jgi:hypothetical protein
MAPAPGWGHLCGLQLSNFQGDNFKHASQIVRDVGIPETQYRDAALIQPKVTPSVSRFVIGVCVLTAVEFNGEPQRRTIEVEYKWACGMLSSKIGTKLAISQLLP